MFHEQVPHVTLIICPHDVAVGVCCTWADKFSKDASRLQLLYPTSDSIFHYVVKVLFKSYESLPADTVLCLSRFDAVDWV